MRRIVTSGAFKVALAFAALLTVATYLVLGLVYLQFYHANVVQVRNVLQNEVKSAGKAPIEQLRQQLALRLTQDLRHLDYVGLYDAANHLAFGNVDPSLVIPRDGKTRKLRSPPPEPLPGGAAGPTENAIFVAAKRADGGSLVLGRSLVYFDNVGAAMLRGSAMALAPVIALAILSGILVSLRASRRLSAIQTAIDHVMRGELHVRLPVRGRNDDIESLVRAVNLMLDEIVRLLSQIKSVGDNIAHDLRSPLAVMRARLERGLAGGSEAKLRALAAEALSDLSRAMTTVTALLRISELESGLRRSAFDQVDLVDVCRDAFDLYAPLAAAKGQTITLDASHPLVVTGDGDLLREALVNLVENAVKFTPAGGSIVIACGADGSLMRVGDTGPGVAAEEREKIFKRFYRASATRATPGTGLGLSMAATIVEMHGFTLEIASQMPGAVFSIVPGSNPEREPGSHMPGSPRKGPHHA